MRVHQWTNKSSSVHFQTGRNKWQRCVTVPRPVHKPATERLPALSATIPSQSPPSLILLLGCLSPSTVSTQMCTSVACSLPLTSMAGHPGERRSSAVSTPPCRLTINIFICKPLPRRTKSKGCCPTLVHGRLSPRKLRTASSCRRQCASRADTGHTKRTPTTRKYRGSLTTSCSRIRKRRLLLAAVLLSVETLPITVISRNG